MLNSLYGKFATNPKAKSKVPKLDTDGSVRYEVPWDPVEGDDGKIRKVPRIEYRDPVYTAVGAFCTAWARDKTIRAAQDNYDRFIYADTDSLHLVGYELPDLEIHPTKLGAWKHEGNFVDSKFLRAKTYMETYEISEEDFNKLDLEGKYGMFSDLETKIIRHTDVKCAGMPENVKHQVNYDNFTTGASYSGKLMPKHYPGGIVLVDTEFMIRKG
jgi:hypothetical protein